MSPLFTASRMYGFAQDAPEAAGDAARTREQREADGKTTHLLLVSSEPQNGFNPRMAADQSREGFEIQPEPSPEELEALRLAC